MKERSKLLGESETQNIVRKRVRKKTKEILETVVLKVFSPEPSIKTVSIACPHLTFHDIYYINKQSSEQITAYSIQMLIRNYCLIQYTNDTTLLNYVFGWMKEGFCFLYFSIISLPVCSVFIMFTTLTENTLQLKES